MRKKAICVCFLAGWAIVGVAQEVIEDFDNVDTWRALHPTESTIRVEPLQKDEGAGMRVVYDLGDAQTYAVVQRDVDLALPSNYEIRFTIEGDAPRNHFEFKAIDADGNTFLKAWRNLKVTGKPQELRVRRRELRYGWGPDREAELNRAVRLEFAVVAGRGGEGELQIGPITFEELEPEPPGSEPRASASSVAGPEHPPVAAVDWSYATSWRSRPFDPQWLEIDFKQPRAMAGLRLYWGLYGDYDVMLSRDGDTWRRVYRVEDADGGLDEIYFAATTARYVRIETRRQAHRDGYSLYELETLDAEDKPLAKASSQKDMHWAEYVLDGDMNTTWQSEGNGRQWLQLDLRGEKAWGGLVIHWEDEQEKTYDIEASTNGLNWWSVYQADDQPGATHRIFLDETESRFLRVACAESGQRYAIREIELKAPEEAMTVTKFYQLAAGKYPGCYPRWLLNEQAYWTIVGTPEDVREAAICEDGTLEPHKRGFTIMPLLRVGDELVTRNEAEVSQSLLEECLPIPTVHWMRDDVSLEVTTLAHGGAASSMYARYRLKNRGTEAVTGSLFLVVHPMQFYPPWQGGHNGFSPIRTLAYTNGVARLDDDRVILFLTPPDRFAAKGGTYGVGQPVEGDMADDVAAGVWPEAQSAEDENGFISGAGEYLFELAPGEVRELFVCIPLHDVLPALNPAMNEASIREAFLEMHAETAAYWRGVVNRVVFDIPDRAVVNTLKANVAYNLITKDGPGFQPGSRSYDKAWMRDGSVAAIALLKFGFTQEVKDFIEWFAAYQFDSGEIPPIIDNKHINPLWEELEQDLHEFDSQGQFVHMVYEYYRYSDDEAFLQKMYPRVMEALRFLQELRERRATAEYRDDPEKREFYNILPPSRSHEGYWLAHSYWDDFWALKGWRDGELIAEEMGETADAEWMRDQYEELKTGVYASIARVVEKYGINYVPGCAEKGDFDATSTAVGIVFCDELDNMPQPETGNTFDRFFTELSDRFEDDAQYVFTPYEIRTVLAFLFMGQKERAIKLLDFLIDCRRPPGWYHLAEVVHSGYRFPCYIGDMPHTWVGAGVINSIRGLFFYEDGETLVVGAGVKPEWVEGENSIRIADAPTRYGRVNLEMRNDGGSVVIELSGDAVPGDGFEVHAPFDAPITSATVNGEEHAVAGDKFHVQSLPAKIVMGR